MQFNEYQVEAMRTATYGAGHKIIYPALSLGEESGEVQGKVSKVMRDGNGNFDTYEFTDKKTGEKVPARLAIAYEMGDVLWEIAMLAHDLGYDLQTIAELNVAKLKGRYERGTIHGSGDNR